MTAAITTTTTDTAIATRVGEIVHDLAVMRREKTAGVAQLEARAMVRAGLAHLQVAISADETKQLLLEEIAEVQRRNRGPHQRGLAS